MKKLSSFTLAIVLLFALVTYQCKPKVETTDSDVVPTQKPLQISLAQWSLHRAFESGDLSAANFASIAKNGFGIDAVEYVATFYKSHATDVVFWENMKRRADSVGVRSLLIMVDNEGDLGNQIEKERKQAVENHFKWVQAAHILGCHSIRINAFGEGTKDEVQNSMVKSLKELCEYAKGYNINVLIENHGLYSSDGKWVAEIMKRVNLSNVGTLPDFGNWCTAVKWGTTENNECTQTYDRYQGTQEMLPFAQGVSAKSYSFNEQGEETIINYNRMLKLVYQSNFDGFIGIEYEGSELSESEGIMATKALVEKEWGQITQSISNQN